MILPTAMPSPLADDCPDPASVSMMSYMLICHARSLSITEGVWGFSLESRCGQQVVEAEDIDHGDLNRLSLLAAVRGLEAIDGQSLVSLVSNNRYLIRSLDQSLPRWRENDFVWEHFGRRTAVQNHDLWRRIDRALGIHQVTASLVQTTRVSGSVSASSSTNANRSVVPPAGADWRLDTAHQCLASPITPTERLRRWLTGDDQQHLAAPPRRRYRAEDLAMG